MSKKRSILVGGIVFVTLFVFGWFIYSQFSGSEYKNADIQHKEATEIEDVAEENVLPPAGPAGTPDGVYRPFTPEDIPYLEQQKNNQKNQ